MKKKLLAAFLCLAMAFSLAACGDSDDAGKTDKKKDSKDDGKKVYQVATDTTFAPFEFENDEGDMVGIDLDILAAIAEDQGFEYELQIAQLNRVIAPDIDTVFLTTNLKYAYLSSSSVKEVAAYGGDISNFVTAGVAEEVHKKFQNKIRGKE